MVGEFDKAIDQIEFLLERHGVMTIQMCMAICRAFASETCQKDPLVIVHATGQKSIRRKQRPIANSP